jgi:hypothetical protein
LRNGKIINVNFSNDYQFLCLPKDASYLLGNNNEEQFLFIRDCYHHLSNIIFNDETNDHDKKMDWHVIGNPGIGKTYFSYYLLYQLAQQNKSVIYDNKDNDCTILFTKYYTLYCSRSSFIISYFNTSEFYHIAEDERLMAASDSTKEILITSPWRYCYKYHDKDCINSLYMSVWSWEEINICRHVNFHHLSQEKVWELYKRWGGIPLYTLYYALNESKQKLLQRAIDISDENLTRYFGEMYFKKDVRYMIAHIFTDEKHEKFMQFASEYISEKIMEKLEMCYKEKLIESLNYPSYFEYYKLSHAIFEHLAHRTLLNGGSFEIQPLFKSMNNSKLIMSKREKLIFNNINDIEPDKYCIPSKKNFICDINAIVSPNMLFIMAISEEFLNNMNGLDKLIDKFIDKSNESIIELYFVTPKYRKMTIAKHKDLLSLNDRIKQYALELDISLICGK